MYVSIAGAVGSGLTIFMLAGKVGTQRNTNPTTRLRSTSKNIKKIPTYCMID